MFFITTKKQAKGVISTLKKIRKTIQNPKHWIKGEEVAEATVEVLDKTGAITETKYLGYDQYCLIGAKQHVDGQWENHAAAAIAYCLPKEYSPTKDSFTMCDGEYEACDDFYGHITTYNDKKMRTHKQVLGLLDRAIKQVENRYSKL